MTSESGAVLASEGSQPVALGPDPEDAGPLEACGDRRIRADPRTVGAVHPRASSPAPSPGLESTWSDAAAAGTRPLIVALHGFGSSERDLAGLAGFFTAVDLVALRAPFAQGTGFMWFPISTPGAPDPAAVDAAAGRVAGWLDAEVAADRPVALLGFSQGGAVALQALRRAPRRYAAAVVLSGFVAPGSVPGDEVLADRRTPVFWGRDVADPVIAAVAIERTSAYLPRHSTLTSRTYPGVGHGIGRTELADVAQFLSTALSLVTSPQTLHRSTT